MSLGPSVCPSCGGFIVKELTFYDESFVCLSCGTSTLPVPRVPPYFAFAHANSVGSPKDQARIVALQFNLNQDFREAAGKAEPSVGL